MTNTVNEITTQQEETETEKGLMSVNEMVLMQTALTEVKNPETLDTTQVRILFDSGSHRSYISESLAKKMNLKTDGEHHIHVATFGSKDTRKITTKYTKLNVKLKIGTEMEITTNVVPLISGELQRRPIKDLESEKVQDIVNSVQLADTLPTQNEKNPIDVLIGNDYYLDFIHSEKIEVQKGLYLLASKLGWIISGRINDPEYSNDDASIMGFITIDTSCRTKIATEDFWNMESIGIVDKQTKEDDVIAIEKFRETIEFKDDRYFVSWPWKEDEPELPTDKELANGRLKSTVNRLKNKPDLLKKYDDVISDQLQKGVIEKVEPKCSDGIVHYLPHHAVVTPKKSATKLRVVYDASAKTKKENNRLNDCLYRGPVMLHDLSGMLMRFRMHRVALVADTEKAFLQIGLHINQRDVTRFVWLRDTDNPSTDNSNLQEYRFTRVAFGVVSSPFLLGATIEYHLDRYKCDVAKQIKNDIYVDNIITGTNSVTEAVNVYKISKRMFNECSMNLREWNSNNDEVNTAFECNDKANDETMKVLGHVWRIKEDTLSFQVTPQSDNVQITKRYVLKRLASVFDPLGFLCPVLLRGKVFLQTLWSKKLKWDDPLCDQDQENWRAIESDFENIDKCCIPRHVGRGTSNPTNRLVCFYDASQKSYACVVYLHQTYDEGIVSHIVFAKTRLAPVQTTTIPRLELLAVVIGFRCLNFVKEQLCQPISSSCLWTDSQCVIHWLQTTKPLSVFVKNRINSLKQHSDILVSYVPTTENPADIASRGSKLSKLLDQELWWNGPEWLSKPETNWPFFENKVSDQERKQFESEEIKPKKSRETTLTQPPELLSYYDTKTTDTESNPLGIDIERFSSVTKLLRVSVLCLRFIRKLKKKDCKIGCITSDEIQEAEIMWLKRIQRKNYQDVFDAINENKGHNLQRQLGIYVDSSEILRCRGRLENANLTEGARFPILLPKREKFTHLLIVKAHLELIHSGVSQVLSWIRHRYWIPHGRATVKAVLKSCGVCRRYEGGSYKLPPMCPYPSSRATESSAFSKIGLDYLGPLTLKTMDGGQKTWICLFTCLTTRAVHLEVVSDMTTAEFLLWFKRFIAQRGRPSEIISDNAQQFKTASNVLDRLWKQIPHNDDVMSYVSSIKIKWSFNVELAPWMGGFYERLVGLVKRAMRKTIGRRLLTLIQLQTLIKEIEAVLNSRPLVYVTDDINSNFPITPAHFLTMNPKTGIPNTDFSEDSEYSPFESSADKIISMWKKGQRLLDTFWKVWKDEYLTSLRERSQTAVKTGRICSKFQPCVNDVVLLKDDTARGNWRFGKITMLIKSRDGQVRSAKVQTPSGRIVGRPLNLLYPLEVCSNASDEDRNKNENAEQPKGMMVKTHRPIRNASLKAKEKIKQWSRDEQEY